MTSKSHEHPAADSSPGFDIVANSSTLTNVFRKYDKYETGAIEIDKLRDLMADLGLLNGRTPSEASAAVVSAFSAADHDRDGTLNFTEFSTYYRRATAPRLGDLLQSQHPEDLAALRLSYTSWASFGVRESTSTPKGLLLGSAHWLKLCKDTALVGRQGLTSTDADLIFAKVKPKGQNRLNFFHFVDALGMVASRLSQIKQQTVDLITVVRQVTCSQPVLNGTTVHVQHFYGSGGTTTSTAATQSASQSRRRVSAPSVSVSASAAAWNSSKTTRGANSPSSSATATEISNLRKSTSCLPPKSAFRASTPSGGSASGGGAGNSSGFKIKAHRSDSSNSTADSRRSSLSSPEEKTNSPAAAAARFSEDTTCTTTVTAPTTTTTTEDLFLSRQEHTATTTTTTNGLSNNIEEVLHRFGEFCTFGSSLQSSITSLSSPSGNNSNSNHQQQSPMRMTMDSKQFMKLCKDSGLVDTTSTSTAVDLAFTKARAKGTRRLSFADFLVALALLAQEKGVSEAEILSKVADCPGPRRNSTTTPDYCRLHDDKSTFTGVYARGGPSTVDASVPDLAKLLSREQGRQV